MQDHIQKFSVSLKHKDLEEQMKAMKSTRRKLEASEEKRFWRQSAPEVLTSSEAPHQKQDHQKQFSSKELKIIRSLEN